MIEIIQIAGSLGVGAFLGTIIFLMYRRDRKDTELRIAQMGESHASRLENLLKQDHRTRIKHTKVLAELNTFLRVKNGKRKT